MKFPFGNKIPFIAVVEKQGKKEADVIIGILGDTEWTYHCDHKEEGYIFLKGAKHGARNIFIVVNKTYLTYPQKAEVFITKLLIRRAQ